MREESRSELTFPCYFGTAVRRFPDRYVLFDHVADSGVTYQQHDEDVRRLARWIFETFGHGQGARFGIIAWNCLAYFQLWHAALSGAGTIVPLNQRLSADELAYVIRDAQLNLIFVDEDHRALLESAVEKSGMTVRLEILPLDLSRVGESSEPIEVREDDVVAQIYTGGTTGRPKGVLLSSRAVILNFIHEQLSSLQPPGLRYLQHAPMFHSGTFLTVVTAAVTGGTTYWLPAFDADQFIAVIGDHRIQATVMLPTLIHRVLNKVGLGGRELEPLRYISYGGAPVSMKLMDRLRSACPNAELAQTYGMTEASSRLTMLTDDDHRHGGPGRLESVGQPVAGVQIRIERADGSDAAEDEVGEICARGGNVMVGYWNLPEATEEALRGGWLHTADLGRMDRDGFLYIVDRKTDMIITGGENVYSTEVEQALLRHDAVEQAAVFGVPDEEWGERVVAIVVSHPDTALESSLLKDFCRSLIAGYKVPKDVVVQSEMLPVSPTNKILKRAIREAFIADTARESS